MTLPDPRQSSTNDLSYLDDLLGELDDLDDLGTSAAGWTAEMVAELRSRAETRMDEIPISVCIEPPPITGRSDIDADTQN